MDALPNFPDIFGRVVDFLPVRGLMALARTSRKTRKILYAHVTSAPFLSRLLEDWWQKSGRVWLEGGRPFRYLIRGEFRTRPDLDALPPEISDKMRGKCFVRHMYSNGTERLHSAPMPSWVRDEDEELLGCGNPLPIVARLATRHSNDDIALERRGEATGVCLWLAGLLRALAGRPIEGGRPGELEFGPCW